MQTPTRFVLLSTQRSGTSWVMEQLAAHPDVGSYGELLLANRWGWPDWPPGASDRPFFYTYLEERGTAVSRFARHSHLFAYLDYVLEPRRSFRAIGLKLMYDEVTPYPELLYYVRRRRVCILHLVRENLLDLALSQIAGHVRRYAHAWTADERDDLRLRVDVRYMMRLLRKLERDRHIARALLAASDLVCHEVKYEDLVADDRLIYGVLGALGVEASDGPILSARMLKLAPVSQREGVANYDEVEAALCRSRFRRYLRP